MKPTKLSTSHRQSYSVVDVRKLYYGNCPHCRSLLFDHKAWLQLYDNEGNAYDFEEVDLYRCNSCHSFFLADNEFAKLVKRAKTFYQNTVFLNPENMTRVYNTEYGGYLYYPKTGSDNVDLFDNFLRSIPSEREISKRRMNSLQKNSFLYKMGYSTKRFRYERRPILQSAVDKYGKEMVIQHLQFLIRSRESQEEGTKKYSDALTTWRSDADYVITLDEKKV